MRWPMSNRARITVLTAAALTAAALHSCTASRKAVARTDSVEAAVRDTAEVFVPTHRPILVNKTWQEAMEEAEAQKR